MSSNDKINPNMSENADRINKTIGDVQCVKNKGDFIHKSGPKIHESTEIKVKSAIPRRRQDLLKWYGWGYQDSKFQLVNEKATFTGDRYLIGGKHLPHLLDFAKEKFDLDLTQPPKIPALPTTFPPSILSESQRKELESIADVSTEGLDRLMRSHGQTLHEVSNLRNGTMPRIPDAVVWPENHDQVEQIVRCASTHKLVIIPFGGGTSVSGSISCPERETRAIVALDTSAMNSILWLDKEQLLARVQAGIVGQDLEREMRTRGFTVGHEPDSYEFSTLGGWVATRASGMKKNTYGNIEDLVVQTKMVTPTGVIEKGSCAPRVSCGPEWEHVVLGSEGCLGVVTEDLALEYGVVAESFETSVPWERTLALCRNTKRRLRDECRARNISHYLISCRLTQTYDAGCCIYFYFGFNSQGLADPVREYELIEEAARDEIIASGGSISHHHGVGKLRKKWYTQAVSEPGRRLLVAAKTTLDPDNIFALNNMVLEQPGPGEGAAGVARSKL
ncbi:alkyldihydroxyacetonephosphate synthase [Leptidea sinapis]|uniref:alkyldihydroxyacetonephosphate synthase n=1 Tax=Leptidea sinapis TaxID=189913 RepID=UPI0021C4A675|nr:alkyldihydroxyacetonephosphate synthase [Leptidea sinapis]